MSTNVSFSNVVMNTLSSLYTSAKSALTSAFERVLPKALFQQTPTPDQTLANVVSGEGYAASFKALADRFDDPFFDVRRNNNTATQGTVFRSVTPARGVPISTGTRPQTLPASPSAAVSAKPASMITSPTSAQVGWRTETNPFPYFPGYIIEKAIGRGSQAIAYQARDQKGEEVVIKYFHQLRGKEDQEFYLSALGGFETRTLRALDRIKDDRGQTIAIVFEKMDGTLDDSLDAVHALFDKYAFHNDQANIATLRSMMTRWFRDIMLGLESIHDRGIIHRDLKPENLYVGDNHVRIGDFGTAICLTDDQQDLNVVASSGFMPPELGLSIALTTNGPEYSHVQEVDTSRLGYVRGLPTSFANPDGSLVEGGMSLFKVKAHPHAAAFKTQVNERCDIYSIGKVFAEMLLGVGKAQVYDTKPREELLRDLRRACRKWGFSLSLADVIMRATEPLPFNRFATTASLSQSLLNALKQVQQSSVAPQVTEQTIIIDPTLYVENNATLQDKGIIARETLPPEEIDMMTTPPEDDLWIFDQPASNESGPRVSAQPLMGLRAAYTGAQLKDLRLEVLPLLPHPQSPSWEYLLAS